MPNPPRFALTFGTSALESLDALLVNAETSQLMSCGHPQGAVISSNPNGIGTCYCGECEREEQQNNDSQ